MQKLIFKNSLKDIDLTSGNFGITNWEGLADVGLDVHTQTVPFVDGSVYIDSLLENRDLNFTVAICDGNDLALRYELKRKLISALNPKLGEGELFYTNDFISVKIKAVPHVPIFENKNSNDSGTLKASVTFTACNPYWEDVNEIEYTVNNGEIVNVENDGDTEVNLHALFLTGGVTNPSIKNLTTGKEIKISGEFTDNVIIDTEFGNKGMSQDIYSLSSDYLNTIGFRKMEECNGKLYFVVNGYVGYMTADNKFSCMDYLGGASTNPKLKNVNNRLYYGEELYAKYIEDGVIHSCTPCTDVCFFENKYVFLTGTFGVTSCYVSESPDLSDGIILSDEFIIYVEATLEYLYLITSTNIKYISHFEEEPQIIPDSSSFEYSCIYQNLVVEDALWIIMLNNTIDILKVTPTNVSVEQTIVGTTFIIDNVNKCVGNETYIGITWHDEFSNYCDWFSTTTNKHFFNNSVFITCSLNNVIYMFGAQDGERFVKSTFDFTQFFNLDVKFSKCLKLYSIASISNGYYGATGGTYLYYSRDGMNWEATNFGSPQAYKLVSFNDDIYFIFFSARNKWLRRIHDSQMTSIDLTSYNINRDSICTCGDKLIIGCSDGNCLISTDGINFETSATPLTTVEKINYTNNLIFICGGNKVAYGNIEDFTVIPNLTSFTRIYFFNGMYIADGKKYSFDLVSWTNTNNNFSYHILNFYEFQNKLLCCTNEGTTIISNDGINYNKAIWTTASDLCNSPEGLLFPGAVLFPTIKKTGEINVINHLTEQSDMSFNFVEGSNQILFGYDSGYATCKIQFNKRYIGV